MTYLTAATGSASSGTDRRAVRARCRPAHPGRRPEDRHHGTLRKLTARLPNAPSGPARRAPEFRRQQRGDPLPPGHRLVHERVGRRRRSSTTATTGITQPPTAGPAKGSDSPTDWCGSTRHQAADRHSQALPARRRRESGRPVESRLEYWDGRSWVPVPGQTPNARGTDGAPGEHDHLPGAGVGEGPGRPDPRRPGAGRSARSSRPGVKGRCPVAPRAGPAGQPGAERQREGPPGRVRLVHFAVRPGLTGERRPDQFPAEPQQPLDLVRVAQPDRLAGDRLRHREGRRPRRSAHLRRPRRGSIPESYTVQSWDGNDWADVPGQVKTPARPAGGRVNTVTFPIVKTSKVRVVFTHRGQARTGLTEIEIWRE